MAWSTLALSTLLPGKPWTSAKALATYENPIAIAAGDANAPKIAGAAMGSDFFLGDVSGAGTTAGTITVPTRAKIIKLSGAVGSGTYGGPRNYRARYSNDGGSSWGSWQVLFAVDSENLSGSTTIDVVSGAFSAALASSSNLIAATGTHTVPSGCDAVELAFEAGADGDHTWHATVVLGVTP